MEKKQAPACSVETILPHLAICNGIFDRFQTADFSGRAFRKRRKSFSLHVKGLYEEARRCYEEGILPDEGNVSWAVPSRRFDPKEITSFSGDTYLH